MVKKTNMSHSALNKFKALQIRVQSGIQKNKKVIRNGGGCSFKRAKTKNQKKSNQVIRMMGGCSLQAPKSRVCNRQSAAKTLVQNILNQMKANAKKRENARKNANERKMIQLFKRL